MVLMIINYNTYLYILNISAGLQSLGVAPNPMKALPFEQAVGSAVPLPLASQVDEGKVNTSSETQRIIALTEEERDAEFNRKMEAVQERLKNWSLLGGSKDGGNVFF